MERQLPKPPKPQPYPQNDLFDPLSSNDHPMEDPMLLQKTLLEQRATQIKLSKQTVNGRKRVIGNRISKEESTDYKREDLSTETIQDNNEYVFKPPAAARYFLWDSTRIGKTVILEPKSIFGALSITSIALKALFMHLFKRHLLSNSNVQISSGFLLGRRDDASYVFDRFDQGTNDNKPSIVKPEDVIIKIIDEQLMDEVHDECSIDTYNTLFNDFQSMNDAIPNVSLFPAVISARIIAEMQYCLTFRSIIPAYTLEIYKIHTIRLVSTNLTYELLGESYGSSYGPGEATIFTPKQHKLVVRKSTLDRIVLEFYIRWFKNYTLTNIVLQILILKFISNAKIKKLDTGKNYILLCDFTDTKNGPVCYECRYNLDTDLKVSFFGTHTFEQADQQVPIKELLMDKTMAKFYNQKMGYQIPPELVSIDSSDSTEKSRISENLANIDIGSSLDHDVQSMENTADNRDQIELNEQPNEMTEKLDNTYIPQAEKIEPPLDQNVECEQTKSNQMTSEPFLNFDPNSPQAQMWYITMLQQQIAVLHAQINPLLQSRASHDVKPNQEEKPPTQTRNASCQTCIFSETKGTQNDVKSATSSSQTDCKEFSEVGTMIDQEHNFSIPEKSDDKLTCEIDVEANYIESVSFPPDNGKNYEPFFPIETGNNDAKTIIAGLVDDPEKSFVFKEENENEYSSYQSISVCSPILKISHRNRSKIGEFTNRTVIDVTRQEESFSIASLEYLRKYGLE